MAELEYTIKLNPDLQKVLNIQAMQAGLTAVGMVLEAQAVKNITTMKAVDTGRLRASIMYKTKLSQSVPQAPAEWNDIIKTQPQDNEVLIGTNVFYAPYIEYGVSHKSVFRKEGDKSFYQIKKREPRPFLRKAFDQWKMRIDKVFGAAYKKVVDSQK